ncbi:MAG: hypothetical protein FWC97_03865 [Treponema sp.]|nr:hypothetical protein [Treponema sp.]
MVGCAGVKSIRFNELSTNTFSLNSVFYMTLFDESEREATEIFASLPIQPVVDQVKTRFGVDIDTSLFLNNDNDVMDIKSYNLAIRNHFVAFETMKAQRISMNFNRLNQNELYVEVRLRVFENGVVVARTDFTTTVPYQL